MTSPVSAYGTAIAAGGDVTSNASLPCNSVTSTNYLNYYTAVSSLEDLVARNPGAACHFGTTKSGYAVANDWRGNSTVSAGTISAGLTPTAPIFATTEQLRLAFNPTGQVVTYLSCQTLVSGGGTWDCTTLGTGTYAIQTLADGRALTTTNLPPEFVRLGYARVFVERGGVVYYGDKNNPGTRTNTVRLNLTAANALFGQLGIPLIVPTE